MTVAELVEDIDVRRLVVRSGELLVVQLTKNVPRELFERMTESLSLKTEGLGFKVLFLGPEFELTVVQKEDS